MTTDSYNEATSTATTPRPVVGVTPADRFIDSKVHHLVVDPNSSSPDEGNVLIDSLPSGWYIVNFDSGGLTTGPFEDRESALADMENLGFFADERLIFIDEKRWS